LTQRRSLPRLVTAHTPSRQRPDRNSAAQQAPDLILANPLELALKSKRPAVYPEAEFVAAGGLASYGPNLPDLFRQAATYVDKILKGAKPADLPIEQPSKFELVINLKTAKALGLTISREFQLRADEVIE
jgi:putative tryptophan/tyrosine transport system substrate-binding protein